MRQILFRAKSLEESYLKGEWVEGSLHQYINQNHFPNNLPIHYAWILKANKVNDIGWDITNTYREVQVDPETISQFTGLTDKNGVKIWGNEWLYATVRSAIFHNYQGKVIFYNGSFLLHTIDPETGLFNNIDDTKPLSDYYELQVINNPELLNQ